MRRKVIFIVLSVLLMITGITYMAINSYKNSIKSFSKAGYILDNKTSMTGNKSTVYYFNENANYKNRYDNNVVFNDVNGVKVNVDEASFIHYNDDSIGVLKKSVILDLNQVNSESPIYYNIFQNSILEYSNGKYYVDNLGKKMKFDNFIVKVSDTKYLIISKDIALNLESDKSIKTSTNYVELNFIDDSVVTIENKDSKYKTIAEKAYIALGDEIKINLSNKYIYVNDEAKMSMDSMIIDSSDNIDIKPLEDKNFNPAKDEEDDDENGNGGGNGENFAGVGGGGDSVAGSVEGVTETEVVESTIALPTADISDLEITANKIEGTIKITDKDSTITGKIVTTLIENSTGRTIDLIESNEGTLNIEVSCEKLEPETTYSLTTNLHYKKNDITYSMDIVQYIFVTSTLGVNIEKNYFTDDSLAFDINFDSFSKVKSCNVNLLNTTGKLLETVKVERVSGKDDGYVANFTKLTSDTKYTIVVDNILYDDYVVSDDYSIQLSAKTLKERPIIGDVSYSIDKKDSKFVLQLNNMIDKQNGVESYKYEIYDTRTMSAGIPVTTIDKGSVSSVDLLVDDSSIIRGVGYVFRVVVEFYDNEKYIEYVTPYSSTMQIDGKEAPSISWRTNSVTFEAVDGTISIVDKGYTVDFDKKMTVVYTNSIGTTEQYTTSGNSIIPFIKNNLRANETYTISVYGTVNFQDGNPPVDNYHIGSATVHTNPTNPFVASFSVDEKDVSSVFKVTARLLNVGNADNRLEASTLTYISFVLHEGTSVNGKIIKTVKKADKNLKEYESDLKENYYDENFILNPAFFGLSNADLSSEYYTIEIKDAFDYTQFQNEIGITNNIVTVKSNGQAPDIKDPDNAVTYEIIRNKDANEYDSKLEATTIVGLRAKADYDNAKRTIKVIHYHVYDVWANKEVESARIDYTVPANGDINFVEFPVGYGTDNDIEDDELRRGNRYYIYYTADLDLNGDGEVDSSLPSNKNTILKSKEIKLIKQDPIVKMYPSDVSGGYFKIAYTYKDVDKASKEGKLYSSFSAYVDNFDIKSSVDIVANQNDYNIATFSGATAGYARIFDYIVNYKGGGTYKTTYIFQKYDGWFTPPKLSYRIEPDINRLIIYYMNYDSAIETYNKFAAIKLKFTSTDASGKEKSIVKDYLTIKDGATIVDLFDLAEFKGKPIKVQVFGYYCNGVLGFDGLNDDYYYAIQNAEDNLGGGEYYSANYTGSLDTDLFYPYGSLFKVTLKDNKYTATNVINNAQLTFDRNVTSKGIVYNYNVMNLKRIATSEFNALNGNDTFTFNDLIPGISIKDHNGNDRITPSIRDVNVGSTVYGFDNGANKIKDDKIYVKIYKTDEDAIDLEDFGTYEFTTETIKSFNISNLLPDQSYAMKFFAEVNTEGGTYEMRQLYDINDNNPAKTYYFRTLSGVKFSDFSYTYMLNKYDDKKLKFMYKMDKTMGFDKIRYVMYERIVDDITKEISYEPIENISIPDVIGLKTNMDLVLDFNPGTSVLQPGKSYKLVVTPIADIKIDGEVKEVELSNEGGEYSFSLRSFRNPYVGVKGSYSSDNYGATNTIDFTVNVYDNDRVVVDDFYTIKIFDCDDRDITPTEYKDYQISTKLYNAPFRVKDLPVGQIYKFVVYYNVDLKNNISSTKQMSYSYSINLLGSDDINVGEISAFPNPSFSNRIDLQFHNSYRLTAIDYMNYSIYNSEDGSSVDGSAPFIPSERKAGNVVFYVQTLKDVLKVNGQYYIQLQFLSDNIVVYDGTVDYTYSE